MLTHVPDWILTQLIKTVDNMPGNHHTLDTLDQLKMFKHVSGTLRIK